MQANNLWIGIIGTMIIIFVLIAIILIIIISARKQRISQELKESQLYARLSEIRFAALRSQMNPHFIFNCLNSIKYYTEQNDGNTASLYLDKFAKLIRSILNNARNEKILLSDEIESIRLYIELEAMRFREKFVYAIEVDKNVDIDFIEIPPMLIQPFVENAIWHGLMPMTSGGKLTLRFTQPESESDLYISITDNGIGRVKAAAIKSTLDADRKSYGMQITNDRIALMNEGNYDGAEVTIEDLYDNSKQPAGTHIIIKLPI